MVKMFQFLRLTVKFLFSRNELKLMARITING